MSTLPPPLDDHAVQHLLHKAHQSLIAGDHVEAAEYLGVQLSAVYSASQHNGNTEAIAAATRGHEFFTICMEDPYTKRAFDKPRGYAGDAVMLDYIYRPVKNQLPLAASTMHQITTCGPMGLSIKFRRELLQAYIDEAIATRKKARILSVASGHCREIEGSLLQRTAHAAEFVAVDQDKDSCQQVENDYGAAWLSVHTKNVKNLLNPSFDIGEFDLVYSAGLYDYLLDSVAMELTQSLAERLRPGGRLLVANFLPNCYGRGYMELVMDWRLLWRTGEQFKATFPEHMREGVVTTNDPHNNVVYAVWNKP